MNHLYKLFTKTALLITLGMPGFLCGAGSSAGTASSMPLLANSSLVSPTSSFSTSGSELHAQTTDLIEKGALYRYYSPENLQRINEINEQLRALGYAPRQKHAPLMIFADPDEAEKASLLPSEEGVFTETLVSAISSNFNPIFIVSFSLFENILKRYDGYLLQELSAKYRIFDAPGTQLVVLIPQWYLDFYPTDHGFQFKNLKDISSLVTQPKMQSSWVKTKCAHAANAEKKHNIYDEQLAVGKKYLGSKKQKSVNLHTRFAQDLGAILAPKREALTPIWDIWFGGHGSNKYEKKSTALIGGLKRSVFIKVLNFFSETQKIGVFYVQSCHAGGVNAHFIATELESWRQALSFDLIFGSSGNTMSSVAFDQSGALSKQLNVIAENYFQQAAIMPSDTQDPARKEAMHNVFDGLIEMSSIGTLGLHGTENLPQVRLKGGTRFKFLKDIDPRYFIVNSKNAQTAVAPSAKTQTVLVYTPSIRKLVLTPCFRKQRYNLSELQCKALELFTDVGVTTDEELLKGVTNLLGQHLLRVEGGGASAQNRLMFLLFPASIMRFFQKNMPNELLDGYDRLLFSSVDDLYKKINDATQSSYPEFMLMMQQKYLEPEPTYLRINELMLNSDNPLIGIHTFFLNAFLTMPSVGLRVIDIDTLIGRDDISILCGLMRAFTEQRFGQIFENASEDVAIHVVQNFFGHFKEFAVKPLEIEDALQKAKNKDMLELKDVRIVVGEIGMTVWFSVADKQFKVNIEGNEVPGKDTALWLKQFTQFYEPVEPVPEPIIQTQTSEKN